MSGTYNAHKLLIANRGEIAARIIRTAKKLGLRTVAIYTPSDALSPHVVLADEAVPLPSNNDTVSATSEANAYLKGLSIISICQTHSVTLVHPGYGFLSENAEFAKQVVDAGMTWLGPRPDVIHLMGMKHEARKVAIQAGLEVVPGSDGLVTTVNDAMAVANKVGFPVILKATAGGGGMGMVVCSNESELKDKFQTTKDRAKVLFGNDGVFVERYYKAARHIEIQVFGNGNGEVVHMRERECSVQRRHQKVIEETPSPFCVAHLGLRERMCDAAVKLAQLIKYGSAGTIEFLVDQETASFFFLEMNTRIQVEHPVTEEIHPGLDIVELMIKQGVMESANHQGLSSGSTEMQQTTYDSMIKVGEAEGRSHSIEGRIYAENPCEGFVPSPGLLQHVSLNEFEASWLRIDSWIETGMTITPHFDPLLAKVVVTGGSRAVAIERFILALDKCRVLGPPQNIYYLKEIASDKTFCAGEVTTDFLTTFSTEPNAFKVLSAGMETTIQDLPGRTVGLGIPRSGPMDNLAFAIGNLLVGNAQTVEGLEIVIVPGVGCSFHFYVPTVVAVTGKDVLVKVNGSTVPMWSRIIVPKNGTLVLEARPFGESSTGFRTYLSIRGGFPDVPVYLGSKSTSMGLGGYQGRSLLRGDHIALGHCSPKADEETNLLSLPTDLIPVYPDHWTVYVLSGPHDEEEFITKEGISTFYSTKWRISPSSNRLGIRLENPTSSEKIQWARTTGGEGGSHPSNILDNGYALGTINVNGDTPVILSTEGPDMGGYLCLCTIATAELWKLGQLAPGSSVQFMRISWSDSQNLLASNKKWLNSVHGMMSLQTSSTFSHPSDLNLQDSSQSPVLHRHMPSDNGGDLKIIFRQAGDSAILVEFGTMNLDVYVRAQIHAFQTFVLEKRIPGVRSLCPCIRSIMCHYDPTVISQTNLLHLLVELAYLVPSDVKKAEFPARRITFPIVLDDSWNREALARYMTTTRDKAVYLPSNIDYLASNNGLSGPNDALDKLIGSDWLVFGVGFYLACPFLVPIDPRCRLIGQKMNPSRTFTPRGSIGIAGPVAAIYPIESPGGYQLYGRTLPTWQTWGKGNDFLPTKPWLLEAFDQVRFKPVSESEYLEIEKQFDGGRYEFQIEPTVFSLDEHSQFLDTIQDELRLFRERQAEASSREEIRERILFQEWQDSKKVSSENTNESEVIESNFKVTSSLYASVWKITCSPGDVIGSASDVLLILEAMKTEIPVTAGEDYVGKTVCQFGKDVKEGASVRPGDVLVTFL
ncbi:hypothetical protein BYT27DRAFT_6537908 [Phlegmacium glaucopus]|nr:hypothetical protein BYT27DRAFT_6537908 [Phlegmacium glaucopus]